MSMTEKGLSQIYICSVLTDKNRALFYLNNKTFKQVSSFILPNHFSLQNTYRGPIMNLYTGSLYGINLFQTKGLIQTLLEPQTSTPSAYFIFRVF